MNSIVLFLFHPQPPLISRSHDQASATPQDYHNRFIAAVARRDIGVQVGTVVCSRKARADAMRLCCHIDADRLVSDWNEDLATLPQNNNKEAILVALGSRLCVARILAMAEASARTGVPLAEVKTWDAAYAAGVCAGGGSLWEINTDARGHATHHTRVR
jgi:hypothetical protein